MMRKVRSLVVNLAVFGAILLYLLYPADRESSAARVFQWTTVNYRTTSDSLPKARGFCPGLKRTSKPALVVARISAEDDEWLDALADKYHLCTYTADALTDELSTILRVPDNRGHEAMAYLTFLIDNYANIPAAGAIFVHGSRWSWHNDHPDYDNAALLEALNVSAALAPWGYHNLRCDWSAGTCSQSDSAPQGSIGTLMRSMTEPFNSRAASDAALPRALQVLFGSYDTGSSQADLVAGIGGDRVLLGRNDAVRAQCCAQFVVARRNIWFHTRTEYESLRQWLLDGSRDEIDEKQALRRSKNAAPPDDKVAGRILSYIWHILFMQPAAISTESPLSSVLEGTDLNQLNKMACPRAEECYCRLYGRCDLRGCAESGRCRGQYRVPYNYKLPDNWEDRHS